jgi:amino acid transporter
MATFKALPDKFARVNPKYLTPGYATVAMGVVSIIFYILMTAVSQNILLDTIGSIGLMIAFYYGLTGYAAAWYYRKVLTRSWSDFLNKGLFPLLGAVSLTAIFIYGLIFYSTPGNGGYSDSVTIFGHKFGMVAVIGVGTLLLGLILMVVYNLVRPDFFRGETLTMGTHLDIIGEPPASLTGYTLPDSGSQEVLVVSTDPEISGLTQQESDTLIQSVDPDSLASETPFPEDEPPA